MSRAADVAAVRTAVTLADGDHLACVRVAGPGAHDLLDRVSPRPLFVRTGQMLHTLLLDDAARPLADVYVCCDDDDYLVVAEGLSGPDVVSYLAGHAAGTDVSLVDLSATHVFLCLDGPYSWELVAELTSPDVIGVPYHGFFHADRFVCFRAGKTGEYGYDLLVAKDRVDEVRAAIRALGPRFELREVGRDVLDLCALEAGFFNVRREVRDGLTPVELQLQWRVGAKRTYPGSDALARHRAAPRGRVALVASAHALAVDAPVELDGQVVGRVLDAGYSETRGEHLAVALLEPAVSHAGLAGFSSGGHPVRTISSPAVNNRSLYVDPQRHSFATREKTEWAPLVRPAWS
jgi:glycine cleavage system aminomethyltransferase T